MRGTSQKLEYKDGLHSNILSTKLYRDQTDSTSGSKNRNLDHFGYEYMSIYKGLKNIQGSQENIDKGVKKISIRKKTKRYFLLVIQKSFL